jgi:capsular exopolysaccharide synthesis family protein
MSHIFDALRRSHAESPGTDLSGFALATELLQAAEAKRQPVAVEDREPPAPEDSAPLEPLASLQHCPTISTRISADSRLVALAKEESLGAEKFRFLAVRLRQLRQSRVLKKILITSTIPGEGKSTVAANLACTLARRKQQRTLLLEGDLRRPSVADKFGLGRLDGLAEWLASDQQEITNLYRLSGSDLWLMPAGSPPANPLELLQSARLSLLMEHLMGLFDWIVVDSPPLLPLADTTVWARLIDGALLVAREGKTEKNQLQRGLELLKKTELLGVVLNGVAHPDHENYYQRYLPLGK